jgi:excisionase family DNA binding protein
VPNGEKSSWSVAEFSALTGIPRATVYELIKAGRLKAKRVGLDHEKRSRLLIKTSPDAFTESLPDA